MVSNVSGRATALAVMVIGLIVLLSRPVAAQAATGTQATWHKLLDPDAGVLVVAHRGCHNAVQERRLDAAPENSLEALENCLVLGVDIMETDVRRSNDGALVIMHDETVDRTTDGVGRVSDLSLHQIKQLYLRQNFGGALAPLVGSQRPLTLLELLAAAKGRILLNLDVKEEIYPQVVDAVLRAGMADGVLIKRVATSAAVALADEAPYRQLLFMPIVDGKAVSSPGTLGAIVQAQASTDRRVPAVEVISLNDAQFAGVRAAARAHHLRIWTNVLTSVGVLGILGHGGDRDALGDPQRVWGGLIEMGVSIFQTDEPAALLEFLKRAPPHPPS